MLSLACTTLSLSLLAAAPTEPESTEPERPTPTRAELDEARFEVYLGARGVARLLDTTQGAGALQLGLGVRLWKGLYLEAELAEGLFGPPLGNAGQINFALTWELRKHDRVRPFATLGFTHAHESSFEHLTHAPAATLIGTAHTIHHRSGALVGGGLRLPWSRLGPVGSRFATYLRTDVAYYFDEGPGRLQVGLGVGVQVVF